MIYIGKPGFSTQDLMTSNQIKNAHSLLKPTKQYRWSGYSVPMGSANGCVSSNCTADQLAGILVSSWSVNPDNTYSMDYSLVVPDGNQSGFGNIPFVLHLEGTIIQPQGVPQLSGAWKSSVNDVVFLFGENMSNISELLINGVNLTGFTQPMGNDNRALLVLADGLKPPYTVQMTTTGGTAMFPEPCTL